MTSLKAGLMKECKQVCDQPPTKTNTETNVQLTNPPTETNIQPITHPPRQIELAYIRADRSLPSNLGCSGFGFQVHGSLGGHLDGTRRLVEYGYDYEWRREGWREEGTEGGRGKKGDKHIPAQIQMFLRLDQSSTWLRHQIQQRPGGREEKSAQKHASTQDQFTRE